MIKGLAITPPVLGRISIGKIVEKNGKRIPEKDDQFTITSQIQTKDGWVKHPLDEQLRSKAQNGKLRTIPVRMVITQPCCQCPNTVKTRGSKNECAKLIRFI